MHYYKHNIADYRKDTVHLSALEHGIYRQLLDWYYLDENEIPLETSLVARRLRLGTDLERSGLENVLSDFFVRTETGWIQPRCNEELAKYHRNGDISRDNGKRGGRGKKTKAVADGNQTGTKAGGKAKANSLTQEPINSSTPIVPNGDGKEDEILKRLRAIFKMRESTPLDKTDRNAWKASKQIAINAPEEEWELLEWHYSQPSGEKEAGSYCKRSISALLNGWNGAIGNARRAKEAFSPQEESQWTFIN